MTLKIISAAALALSMTAGVALAQETNSTSGAGSTTAIDQAEMEMRKPFYTDEGMTTLRPMEEFTSTFNSMSAEQQAAMRAKCTETLVQSPRDEFCVSVNQIETQ